MSTNKERSRRVRGSDFYDSTEVDGDCLRWTGAHTSAGYGNYWDPEEKKNIPAHVWIYQHEVGPVPDGMELDHVYARGCRFTDCVKVEHLEPVTHAENVRRFAALTIHCPAGHEYTPENTYVRDKGNGIRQCRVCHRDEMRASRARKESS